MAPSFPEVTTQGLILWRVRHSAGDQSWCVVSIEDGELLFVYNPVDGDAKSRTPRPHR